MAAVLLAYALLWRDWISFFRAIDHSSSLFTDFRFHFYPMAVEILKTAKPVHGYFYSAFFALLIHPLAWFSLDSAAHLWGWFQSLAFAALCLLPLARLMPLSRRSLLLYVLLCMTSYPAISNFKWGQVSVLLTLLSVGAFDAASRKRGILAGVILAVAASIKYYSGVFILFFLVRRDVRACVSFAGGGFLFFVVFPMLFLGPDAWFSFHQSVMATLADSDWIAGDMNSQYFPHVVGRWSEGFSLLYHTPSRGLVALSWLLALPHLVFLFRVRRNATPEAAALSLALIFTALPFLVATSWPHYFVSLPFCQMAILTALIERLPQSRPIRYALFTPIGLSILFASLPFFLLFPVWASYTEKGFLLFSNAALLPPLYAWALRIPAEGRAEADDPEEQMHESAAHPA